MRMPRARTSTEELEAKAKQSNRDACTSYDRIRKTAKHITQQMNVRDSDAIPVAVPAEEDDSLVISVEQVINHNDAIPDPQKGKDDGH